MVLRIKSKKILISVFAIIGLLVIGEIICRIKVYIKTRDTNYLTAPFYYKAKIKERSHRKENYKIEFRSGQENYYKLNPGFYPASEFGYDHTINSMGFRNKEFNLFDKSGKIRIFCIGGSTTFGYGVSDNETYPYRLQYYLENKNGNKFEVINAAFNGYTSLNCLNLIRYELIKYKPDLFIVMEGINDIRYEKIASLGLLYYIHQMLYYKSMLYTLLIEKISYIEHKSAIPILFSLQANSDYKNNMEKIIKLCRDNDIRIIFVRQMVFTNRDLFMLDSVPLQTIKQIEKKYSNNDSYLKLYYHNGLMYQLRELCQEYGIKFMDLRKEFYRAMKNNEGLFTDHCHLTARANDIIAYAVAGSVSD